MTDRDSRHFAPERHATILDILEREGRVVSAQLAVRLAVSIDTVRRDLDDLEATGALRRVHGGAVRVAPGPRRFADRVRENDPAKARVAEMAVPLIAPGTLVALGGGTTTLLLACALPRDLEATLVTPSPDVALALGEHPRLDVDLVGGRLDRVSQTLVGGETVEQIRRLRPDACVLSTCGVDVEAGVTLREREEALVVRAMVERSQRLVVLATADKLAAAGSYVVAPAARIDVLVTDAAPELLTAYAQLGVTLVTPAAPSVPSPVPAGA